MTPERIAGLRKLKGEGLTSAVGEYTPDELWEALDTIDSLRELLERVASSKYLDGVDWPELEEYSKSNERRSHPRNPRSNA